MPGNHKLVSKWLMALWLLACALAAFLVAFAGFALQDWAWPPPAGEIGRDDDAAPFAPSADARTSKADGVMPLPEGACEMYALSRPDAWGGRFQGFYETDMPAAEVLAFYRRVMPDHGWRPDVALSSALSSPETGHSLAFTRGRQRFLLSIFPNDESEGCDFYLSIISRPGAAGEKAAEPRRIVAADGEERPSEGR